MDRSLYNDHQAREMSHWWFKGRRTIIKTLLEKTWGEKRFSTIADVGSGAGGMVSLLRQFGNTLSLFEPDRELGEYLRERMITDKNVNVCIGSLDDIPEKEFYDAVSLFDVLEHISDDEESLQKIHSFLKQDGFIILTVPAFSFLWSSHDDRNGHKRRYTKKELNKKLENAGFTIVRSTYFNTFLFPLVYLVRILNSYRHPSDTGTTDFSYGSGFLNQLLYFIFSAERLFLKAVNFPFGVSIFCIARKK